MKKILSLRSIFSLALLLIAASALIAGIKVSVVGVEDAAFFPVAAIAVILSFLLGFSGWSTRRVWMTVIVISFIIAFIESAKLIEPFKMIIRAIPQFELDLVSWVIKKEPPDISIFQIQFSEIIKMAGTFISRILNMSVKHPSVREFLWDIPLLLLATWMGWEMGRRNQTLLALAPTLALHASLLNYTGKDTLSLQIGVFTLILLIGINQKWSISQERSENFERAKRETYSVIIILSIVLAIIAGITPSISIKEVAQKLTRKDALAKAIGLEREITQTYSTSGLPRQHLIGLSPKLSQMVIFTVKTGELVPTENAIINQAIPRHYWRWLTYDIYTGRGWATSPVQNNSYPANQQLLLLSSKSFQGIHQQVEKALPKDSRLYWTGSLASVTQPFNASWRTKPDSPNSALGTDMLGAVTEKQIYQADSIIPIVNANQLRNSSQDYPQEIRARYLSLPKTIPQRVKDLAQELTASINNPYDKAKAIEAYLRTYPYSLDLIPPPPNRDVVDYFLFDLKTGYCDYYASSMIVMARAVGLPARLVIGYANGIYDPRKAAYVVHEAEAHSWVEVYFTGIGWVEFEPTASQLQITLPDDLPQEDISPVTDFPLRRTHSHIAYAKTGFFPYKHNFPFAILLALTTFFSSFWFLYIQGLLRFHRSISSIYEFLFFHGKKIYRNSPLHETPSIFSAKLINQLKTGYSWLIPASDEIKLLTDLYIREAYSAHPITKEERLLAVKVWRKLFWRLLYARMIVRL